ncbi:MAG: sugar ABC transporter substrate-binding protein, partial [Pseudomonadota bacterium]
MLDILKRAALGTTTAMALASAAIAGPYDEYAGTTLVVNFPAHPHYNAVMQILPVSLVNSGK